MSKKSNKISKGGSKKGQVVDSPVPTRVSDRKSVDIRKVNNGFVVSSYCCETGKDITYVATGKKQAEEYASKLLKIK